MKLSNTELNLLAKTFGNSDEFRNLDIERISEKPFDFKVKGETTKFSTSRAWYSFSAWLPLYVIRELNWIQFADMSDYPEMVREGDWSGIRDSSKEKIWAMFEKSGKIFN